MRQPTAVIVWQPSPDASHVAMPVYSEDDERARLAGLTGVGVLAQVFIPDRGHDRRLALALVDVADWTRAELRAGHALPESQRHRTVPTL